MPPSKKGIEVSNLLIKLIIFLRSDDNAIPGSLRSSNGGSEFTNFFITPNSFTVADPELLKFFSEFFISINSCNHEWTKKISFATLINAKMRRKLTRHVHFFIPK